MNLLCRFVEFGVFRFLITVKITGPYEIFCNWNYLDEVIGWRIPLMTLTPGMKIHRMDMTLACMQEWFYDTYWNKSDNLIRRPEINGHGNDFGHEFVSESVSEADSDTDTRFCGTSDTRVRSSLTENFSAIVMKTLYNIFQALSQQKEYCTRSNSQAFSEKTPNCFARSFSDACFPWKVCNTQLIWI